MLNVKMEKASLVLVLSNNNMLIFNHFAYISIF